jgi:uncharacterized protein (TIGR00251 family)
MPPWIKDHRTGSTLSLYIQPGASKSEVTGEHANRLKINISSRPVDGEANVGLLKFLSEKLNISTSKIHLLHGETSRQKTILVELTSEKVINELLS